MFVQRTALWIRARSIRSKYNMHLLQSSKLHVVVRSNPYSGITFLSNIRLNSHFIVRTLIFLWSVTSWTEHNCVTILRIILRAEFQSIYKNATIRTASGWSYIHFFEQSPNIPVALTDIYVNVTVNVTDFDI